MIKSKRSKCQSDTLNILYVANGSQSVIKTYFLDDNNWEPVDDRDVSSGGGGGWVSKMQGSFWPSSLPVVITPSKPPPVGKDTTWNLPHGKHVWMFACCHHIQSLWNAMSPQLYLVKEFFKGIIAMKLIPRQNSSWCFMVVIRGVVVKSIRTKQLHQTQLAL